MRTLEVRQGKSRAPRDSVYPGVCLLNTGAFHLLWLSHMLFSGSLRRSQKSSYSSERTSKAGPSAFPKMSRCRSSVYLGGITAPCLTTTFYRSSAEVFSHLPQPPGAQSRGCPPTQGPAAAPPRIAGEVWVTTRSVLKSIKKFWRGSPVRQWANDLPAFSSRFR